MERRKSYAGRGIVANGVNREVSVDREACMRYEQAQKWEKRDERTPHTRYDGTGGDVESNDSLLAVVVIKEGLESQKDTSSDGRPYGILG